MEFALTDPGARLVQRQLSYESPVLDDRQRPLLREGSELRYDGDEGIAHLCASQKNTLLWVCQRNGKVTIRPASDPQRVLAKVASIPRSSRCTSLHSTDGHVWMGLTNAATRIYDAWTFELVTSLTSLQGESPAFILSVPLSAGSLVSTISEQGTAVFYRTSTLEFTSKTTLHPLRNQQVTSVDTGGRYLFIGTSLGEVVVVTCSATASSLIGKWQACDPSQKLTRLLKPLPVTCVTCSRGYVVTADPSDILLWDPFPVKGDGRMADLVLPKRKMPSLHPAGASVVSIIAVEGVVLSADTTGIVAQWEVTNPYRRRYMKLPYGLRAFVGAGSDWAGHLVWAIRHDMVSRHMSIQMSDKFFFASQALVAAQSRVMTKAMRQEHTLMEAPAKLRTILSSSLAVHMVSFWRLGCLRRCYHRLRDYRAQRRGPRVRAIAQFQLMRRLVMLRFCFARLFEFRLEAQHDRKRLQISFLIAKNTAHELTGRTFDAMRRHAQHRSFLRRKLRQAELIAQRLANAIITGVMLRYFVALHLHLEKKKLMVPKRSAAMTLLRCTTAGYIRVVYNRWRTFASNRQLQRQLINQALLQSRRGMRLKYFDTWKRWSALKRQHKHFDGIMRGIGDLGLMHCYFRKLKMFPSWKSMHQLESQKDNAAKHFKLLVDEEQEFLNGTLSVQMKAWPACAITSALGLNIEKWMRDGMVFFAGESQEYTGMRIAAQKLRTAWAEKPGDILSELSTNLAAPPGSDKEAVLWELCLDLHKKYAKSFSGVAVGPIEILAMRLYTLEGPDVDRHMGFGDVPPPFTAVPEAQKGDLMQQWDLYKKHHASVSKPTVSGMKVKAGNETQKGDRNPSIYNEMNKALRTSDDLEKWAKLSSLLLALSMPIDMELHDVCSQTTDEEPDFFVRRQTSSSSMGSVLDSPSHVGGRRVLWRGIHNLPAQVMDAHRKLERGWSYAWLAPSSTSERREASVDFLKSTDSSSNILFCVCGATEGLPLHKVSQFPDEAEVLLPPFSTFRVEEDAREEDGWLLVTLRFQGSLLRADGLATDPEMIEFINDVREDVHRAVQRRKAFQATRQIQGVEETARQYTDMERDLLIERLKSLHVQYTWRIRINDKKTRRNLLLKSLERRKREVAAREAEMEELRLQGLLRYSPAFPGKDRASTFRAILLSLKENGVLGFTEDADLIGKMHSGFASVKLSPIVTAKESYNEIRGIVTVYAGEKKRPNEGWPLGVVKRMPEAERRAMLRAIKCLVLACDHLQLDSFHSLVAWMDEPLDNVLHIHTRLRENVGKQSPFSNPVSPTSMTAPESALVSPRSPLPPAPKTPTEKLSCTLGSPSPDAVASSVRMSRRRAGTQMLSHDRSFIKGRHGQIKGEDLSASTLLEIVAVAEGGVELQQPAAAAAGAGGLRGRRRRKSAVQQPSSPDLLSPMRAADDMFLRTVVSVSGGVSPGATPPAVADLERLSSPPLTPPPIGILSDGTVSPLLQARRGPSSNQSTPRNNNDAFLDGSIASHDRIPAGTVTSLGLGMAWRPEGQIFSEPDDEESSDVPLLRAPPTPRGAKRLHAAIVVEAACNGGEDADAEGALGAAAGGCGGADDDDETATVPALGESRGLEESLTVSNSDGLQDADEWEGTYGMGRSGGGGGGGVVEAAVPGKSLSGVSTSPEMVPSSNEHLPYDMYGSLLEQFPPPSRSPPMPCTPESGALQPSRQPAEVWQPQRLILL